MFTLFLLRNDLAIEARFFDSVQAEVESLKAIGEAAVIVPIRRTTVAWRSRSCTGHRVSPRRCS
ncbi:MAG: hypothetical protein O3C21_11075 [Verrucomicrobia bacterium]|nr:hypothetical protein [Verrucomicrobiota bacterium]